jgi:hypothetical protein
LGRVKEVLMRTILIILVSIVFLFGCDFPTDFMKKKPDPEIIEVSYRAIIQAETIDGEPCINAWIEVYPKVTWGYTKPYKVTADTLGKIHTNISRDYTENTVKDAPIEVTVFMTVYRDDSEIPVKWEGDIPFKKYSEIYEPFKVVFPNSP